MDYWAMVRLKEMIQILSHLWHLHTAKMVFVIILTLTLVTLFWLLNYFFMKNDTEAVPGMKVRPVLSYWQLLMTTYRQKSARAYMLTIMAGIFKLYKRNKLLSVWLGLRQIIFFMTPDTVEAVLNNSKTISKSAEYRFLEPWLGTGLLTSAGDKWRYHRKLLTSTFHFQILENFFTTFNEESIILTQKLESEVGKPWINIVPMITMCTLDTICQTAMGVNLNTQSGSCKEYLKRIDAISDVFLYRIFRPWLWPDFTFFYCSPTGWKFRENVKSIHDFTRKVIKEKKECMQKHATDMIGNALTGKPKKKALLELLLEIHLENTSLTEEDIREEVDTFMFEGHDTTAMCISWTLYELGRNPDIQEKVFQELDSIFGCNKNREVTSEDLKAMKYLECVIKESLRLYPSVAFIGRKLTEKLTIDNFTLQPGCTCLICIFMLHQDPDQFPRPEIFDPDRFLPENSGKRHPYAYLPFSAGPRNCIGQRFALMEVKTVLAHILRKFKITSLDPRDKLETLAGLVLKNADPIRIQLSLRKNKDAS